MRQYSAAVEQYFRRPAGELRGGCHGRAGSYREGAIVCFSANVVDGQLRELGFRSYACPHIMAACGWLVEELEGRPPEALQELDLEQLIEKFEIPVEKMGKLLILKDAARACYESCRG